MTGAQGNIHWHGGGGTPTGTYLPDGRAIDPLSAPSAFDTASTGADFGSLAGLDPNGAWTLFVADVSAGGGQSAISSWRLGIAAIPEPPTTLALAISVLGFVVVAAGRRAYTRIRIGWRGPAESIPAPHNPGLSRDENLPA